MNAATLHGTPASSGVATGDAHGLHRRGDRDGTGIVAGGSSDLGPAIGIDQALDVVSRELSAAAARLREAGHAAEAEIVSVGALIAEDPVLRAEAAEAVAAGRSSIEALTEVTDRHARAMESLRDPVLRERAADIRQVGRRAAAVLSGAATGAREGANGDPVILIADELGPAEVLGGDGMHVAGAVAVRGGPNSHAAIVARTLGLPLVLGVDASILEVPDGASLVIDGDAGSVTVAPSSEDLRAARAAMDAAGRRRTALAAERGLPCETTDGRRFGLLCNVATEAETRAGLEAGAEGVGLLRTELTFLEAEGWPDEAAHRRVLEPILRLLQGRPAIVRVLDFGGDKVPPFLQVALERGAGPHARGLPALLESDDALGAQLRAALVAGRGTRLGILVPMVTSLREVRLARDLLRRAVDVTGATMPELGVMIEVPSAALLADRLAQELDFLSVGTNDLTEHALGVGRRDPSARPALAAHPSVLTLINRVARAGRDHGCAVRICGEAAADPLVVPLLVGVGVDTLSVSPAKVDEVRARVRRLSFDACADIAREAMASDSIDEVWDLVRARSWPELP